MGYRSDVRFAIAGEPNKIKAFITEQKLVESNQVFKTFDIKYVTYTDCDLIEGTPVYTKKSAILFEGDYLKWYDNYPDVQSMEKLYSDAVERDFECSKVIVGEEYGDVIYEGDFFYLENPIISNNKEYKEIKKI